MIDLIKKHKLNIGLALLVQSASFLILFFILLKKKKSIAGAFLAISAIGGASGAYLVLKAAKEEAEAYEKAAKDAFSSENGSDCFSFDCGDCDEDCPEKEVEVVVTDTIDETVPEEEITSEMIDAVEDIFTEPVPEV